VGGRRAEARDLSLLHSVQTGSEGPTDSYRMGVAGSPGLKRPEREANNTLSFSAGVKAELYLHCHIRLHSFVTSVTCLGGSQGCGTLRH
jgi:hypothetical protein